MVSGAGRSVTLRVRVRAGGPVGHRMGVEAGAEPPRLGHQLGVAERTDPSTPGCEPGVHGPTVVAGQAGGLASDQGGPPLARLAGRQGGHGLRELVDQCVGQTDVPCTPVRRLPEREGDLRGHAGANPALGHRGVSLGPSLRGVERHRHPGLRRSRRALELLESADQVDALSVGRVLGVERAEDPEGRPHLRRRE